MESACSTPYASAPSSPARSDGAGGGGYFYSAPTSPIHFMQRNAPKDATSADKSGGSFEFEFGSGAMRSADELFLNGEIRSMKLALVDLEIQEEEEDRDGDVSRGRDPHRMNKSMSRARRKTRSLSPPASSECEEQETTPSTGRSKSKKWVFLKELLNRSKSEGDNTRRRPTTTAIATPRETSSTSSCSKKKFWSASRPASSNGGGVSKRTPSAHYAARRAEKEEMKKKTYIPYRQAGLLGGCFFGLTAANSNYYYCNYGSINPVSSSR